MPQWTLEQEKAISAKDANILVNAAAGSGKTAVLVERIIQKITNPENNIDVDSLLVVTFTKAAAAEMRERISMSLTDALRKDPKNAVLKRQLLLLNYADITTIDSFCHNIVRSNFHLLGLDPNFSIGDQSETELLKSDAIDNLFEELYLAEDKDFLELVSVYSRNRSDNELKKIILDIYEYVSTLPNARKWFDNVLENYSLSDGIENSPFIKTILERVKIMLDDCKEKNTALQNFVKSGEEIRSEYVKTCGRKYDNDNVELDILTKCQNTLYKKYPEKLAEDAFIIDNLQNSLKQGWDCLYTNLKDVKFSSAPQARTLSTAHAEYLAETRKYIRDTVTSIPDYVYDKSDNIEDIIRNKLYPIVRKLIDLVEKFSAKFMEIKHGKNLYSFSDIEYFCLDLLVDENGNPNELALSLREKYSEIMLDEYQDSNELQETIFKTISNGKNMFMVGDMKQSIYRFRNSDPTLFKSKSDTFPTEEGSDNLKIVLSKNFRSRNIILDSTNELFKNIMSETIGEIDYNDEQRLNFGAGCYPDGTDKKSEFYVIDTNDDETENSDNTDDDYESPEAAELEAKFIAQRIKELKQSGFMVSNKDGTQRKLENNDIAILLRSPKSKGAVIADELKRNNIEAFIETSGYFEKLEIMLMISLLKTIQNPTQDIPLIAVMRSVIGNFDDNDLADIRMCQRGYMYDALVKACESKLSDELKHKCTVFLDNLNRWREYSKYMSSDKLIWTLYTETDYYSYVGALAGGEEGQANLRLLFERAKTYESSGFKGLFNFINLVERMINNESNLNPAKLITENHNVVRIMSMHKSKGLEFPVVFISASQKKFYETKPSGNVVMHKDLGLGLEYINPKLKYHCSTVTKEAVRLRSEIENISEEMRILYVAMTRAREKLIVTGTSKDAEKLIMSIDNMAMPMSKSAVLNANSYMNWIAPIAVSSDKWEFKKITSEQILKQDSGIANDDANSELKPSDIDIDKLFDYAYPFEKAPYLPSKISVTELKRRKYEEDTDAIALFDITKELAVPEFMTQTAQKFTRSQIGTIMHFVMQNITLNTNMTEEWIKAEIDNMAEKHMLSDEERKVVDTAKIVNFFKSDLGRRMVNAKECFREVPFEIEISANEYDKTLGENYADEKIILQGIIDGYFIENGNIILFDYKTDRYRDISDIADRYKMQIDYYERALEKTLNQSVSEKYIYLFDTGYTLEL